MLLSYICFAPLFWGATLAQADITEILTQLPACTTGCAAPLLADAQCGLAGLSSCLCTNITLQSQLSTCVLGSCNLTAQAISITILQNEICQGVPQPSRSGEIICASIIMAAVTYPVVILRCISRLVVAHKIWWDDWAVMVAAVCMAPMTAILILNSAHGFGKHFWDVPPQNLVLLRQLYYVSQILYVVVQSLAKASILLLYLRIFLGTRFRLVTQIVLAFVVCHAVAFLVAVALQCLPVQSIWEPDLPKTCINSLVLIYAGAACSIVEDCVIMVLPIAALKDLDWDLKKKVSVAVMFAVGSFACVTSMIRLKFIISYGNPVDVTWDNVDVILWSEIETSTAVICACLLCIRPLLAKILPSIFPSTSRTGYRARGAPKQSWGQTKSSKLSGIVRVGCDDVELLNDDETKGNINTHSRNDAWDTDAAGSIELWERSKGATDEYNRRIH